MTAWDWQDDAACAQMGFDLFFGPEYERHADRVKREPLAKAICAGCEVRTICLEWSVGPVENGAGLTAKAGIWGGLNEEERIAERRRRTRRADDERKADRRREARSEETAA
jgi:WhiB family redox-sensing transcriptional regulator